SALSSTVTSATTTSKASTSSTSAVTSSVSSTVTSSSSTVTSSSATVTSSALSSTVTSATTTSKASISSTSLVTSSVSSTVTSSSSAPYYSNKFIYKQHGFKHYKVNNNNGQPKYFHSIRVVFGVHSNERIFVVSNKFIYKQYRFKHYKVNNDEPKYLHSIRVICVHPNQRIFLVSNKFIYNQHQFKHFKVNNNEPKLLHGIRVDFSIHVDSNKCIYKQYRFKHFEVNNNEPKYGNSIRVIVIVGVQSNDCSIKHPVAAVIRPPSYELVYSGSGSNALNPATLVGCGTSVALAPSGNYDSNTPAKYSFKYNNPSLLVDPSLTIEVRTLPKLQLINHNQNYTTLELSFTSVIRSQNPYAPLNASTTNIPYNWNLTQGTWNQSTQLFNIKLTDVNGNEIVGGIVVNGMKGFTELNKPFLDRWNLTLGYPKGLASGNQTIVVSPVVANCFYLLYPHATCNSAAVNITIGGPPKFTIRNPTFPDVNDASVVISFDGQVASVTGSGNATTQGHNLDASSFQAVLLKSPTLAKRHDLDAPSVPQKRQATSTPTPTDGDCLIAVAGFATTSLVIASATASTQSTPVYTLDVKLADSDYNDKDELVVGVKRAYDANSPYARVSCSSATFTLTKGYCCNNKDYCGTKALRLGVSTACSTAVPTGTFSSTTCACTTTSTSSTSSTTGTSTQQTSTSTPTNNPGGDGGGGGGCIVPWPFSLIFCNTIRWPTIVIPPLFIFPFGLPPLPGIPGLPGAPVGPHWGPGAIPTVPPGGCAANPFGNFSGFSDGTFNVYIGGAFNNYSYTLPMTYRINRCRYEIVLGPNDYKIPITPFKASSYLLLVKSNLDSNSAQFGCNAPTTQNGTCHTDGVMLAFLADANSQATIYFDPFDGNSWQDGCSGSPPPPISAFTSTLPNPQCLGDNCDGQLCSGTACGPACLFGNGFQPATPPSLALFCAPDQGWPLTQAGTQAAMPCANPSNRYSTRYCDSTGTWQEPTFSVCACPADPVNNFPSVPGFSWGTAPCPSGTNGGLSRRWCNQDGSWAGIENSCGLYCPPVTDLGYNWVSTQTLQYQTFQCVAPSGQTFYRQCNGTGYWETVISNCQCPQDNDGTGNGWAAIQGKYYQTSTCGTGYVGNRYRVCNVDGTWSTFKDTSQCIPACEPQTLDGYTFPKVSVGQYASVQCQWPTTATMFTQCQNNGQFGSVGTSCSCPDDNDGIGNGWASIQATYYQTSTCGVGYIGTRTRVCNIDGTWSTFKDTSNCQPACLAQQIDGYTFPEVAVGQYASVACQWPSGQNIANESNYVISSIIFTKECPFDNDGTAGGWPITTGGYVGSSGCGKNYRGTRTRQCNVDGTWSTYKDTSQCVAQCPGFTYNGKSIGPIDVGTTYLKHCPTNTGASQGDPLTYQISCQSNQQWGSWQSYCACPSVQYQGQTITSGWSGQTVTPTCTGSSAKAAMYCAMDGDWDYSSFQPCSCPSNGYISNGLCYICDSQATWNGAKCVCNNNYYGDGVYCFPKKTNCIAADNHLQMVRAWCAPGDCIRFMCKVGFYQWGYQSGFLQLDNIDPYYCEALASYVDSQQQYITNYANSGIDGWFIWTTIACGWEGTIDYQYSNAMLHFHVYPAEISPPFNWIIPRVPQLCNGCYPMSNNPRMQRVLDSPALNDFVKGGGKFPTAELAEDIPSGVKEWVPGYDPPSYEEALAEGASPEEALPAYTEFAEAPLSEAGSVAAGLGNVAESSVAGAADVGAAAAESAPEVGEVILEAVEIGFDILEFLAALF
ncbi:hypothetical protein HDU76_013353, partial [Blyttiomyces sp. JEL0837]